ncbi:MAG: hypothetical protein IPK83_13910 [Planctomycetes bacterium]|nr:hypothetical protein [Planctomycetota bacterium]
MALTANEPQVEAVGSGRKWAIGANVTISIVAAVALVVAVNYMASLKFCARTSPQSATWGSASAQRKSCQKRPAT